MNRGNQIIYLEQPTLQVIPSPFRSVVMKRHLSPRYFLEIITIQLKDDDLLLVSYLVELIYICNYYQPRNLKGGIGSLFDPCVNAMGRRPYWPSRMEVSYFTLGFGVICAHDRYRVIHHVITFMREWFESSWESQLTLKGVAWQAYLRKNAEVQ